MRCRIPYRVDGGEASLGGGGGAHSGGEGDGGCVVDHTAGSVGLLEDEAGGDGRHRGHGHGEEDEGVLGEKSVSMSDEYFMLAIKTACYLGTEIH